MQFRLSGHRLLVAEDARLDFEAKKASSITVRASDAAGEIFDQTLTIDLTDIADTFIGNKRNKILKGTDGDELIDSRVGSDRLTGSDDADTFASVRAMAET